MQAEGSSGVLKEREGTKEGGKRSAGGIKLKDREARSAEAILKEGEEGEVLAGHGAGKEDRVVLANVETLDQYC